MSDGRERQADAAAKETDAALKQVSDAIAAGRDGDHGIRVDLAVAVSRYAADLIIATLDYGESGRFVVPGAQRATTALYSRPPYVYILAPQDRVERVIAEWAKGPTSRFVGAVVTVVPNRHQAPPGDGPRIGLGPFAVQDWCGPPGADSGLVCNGVLHADAIFTACDVEKGDKYRASRQDVARGEPLWIGPRDPRAGMRPIPLQEDTTPFDMAWHATGYRLWPDRHRARLVITDVLYQLHVPKVVPEWSAVHRTTVTHAGTPPHPVFESVVSTKGNWMSNNSMVLRVRTQPWSIELVTDNGGRVTADDDDKEHRLVLFSHDARERRRTDLYRWCVYGNDRAVFAVELGDDPAAGLVALQYASDGQSVAFALCRYAHLAPEIADITAPRDGLPMATAHESWGCACDVHLLREVRADRTVSGGRLVLFVRSDVSGKFYSVLHMLVHTKEFASVHVRFEKPDENAIYWLGDAIVGSGDWGKPPSAQLTIVVTTTQPAFRKSVREMVAAPAPGAAYEFGGNIADHVPMYGTLEPAKRARHIFPERREAVEALARGVGRGLYFPDAPRSVSQASLLRPAVCVSREADVRCDDPTDLRYELLRSGALRHAGTEVPGPDPNVTPLVDSTCCPDGTAAAVCRVGGGPI